MFNRRSAMALAVGMSLAGLAYGQATTGAIFGQAAAGQTVQIQSTSGVTRQVQVDQSGRYSFASLPLGTYTVTVVQDGKTVDTRNNVTLRVGAGTEVDFASAANAQNLGAITVSASALPAIDVSAVDSRTVVTQQQLQQLPLGRSAEAIALLAPGVAQGATGTGFASPTGQALVSFGGSSVSENAYYINGMNTTDPINGYGGMVLPYGAIDQEEVLTGGYGAMYGRSDGGVISIVGRRGTNEWHFGGQLLYTPQWGKADPRNTYFADGSSNAGELYRYNNENKTWNGVASGYAGGPLIKDKLFAFVAAEGEKTAGKSIASVAADHQTNYSYTDPKLYAKLDWNIDDNNLLEVTGASYKDTYAGNIYNYDNETRTRGDFVNAATEEATKQSMWVAKYTGYLTDNLTVSAQFGRQRTQFYTQPGAADPNLIRILGSEDQDPNLNGGVAGGITNPQNLLQVSDPAHESRATNWRLDVSYQLGDHLLSAGLDNQSTEDNHDGASMFGNAGFAWEYGAITAGQPLAGGQVTVPAGVVYYVDQYRQETSASVMVKQRAQYIEDKWQVNDRVLLSLGLRNDQFTNYNGSGEPYINQHKPQWAPRLGATWDVFGDSTFKVYANAGRYYLALPAAPALRAASGSYYTRVYGSYTDIDPVTGYPIGFQPFDTVNGPGAEISLNNEYGQAPDPKTVTAKGLKAEYQDEFIAGFDKTLGQDWVYGAKLTYRKLGTAIDDFCDIDAVKAKSVQMGYDLANQDWSSVSCYLFNAGRSNDFLVGNTDGGYDTITMTNKDFGFPKLKRHYYSAELHLEHPKGDSNWWGRVSYVYSRSYGNSEGQTDSDAGTRSDPSVTQAWDNAPLMAYSNGLLANDHTHAFKAFGAYQVTPEFMVAGNLVVQSGSPRNCYGAYGPDQIDAGYGVYSYHFCGGQPSRPGDAGRNPTTHVVSINAEYRPAFADHKLAFSVDVHNVFNEQKKTQSYPYYGVSDAPNPYYNLPIAWETPRYVRFGVSYDY
ncbi:TonB-dependent receptor [Frateuria sp.]|uniref:TonB-dependent receptor n=1 Tax=Frateuria sp. TaxID=2211372 RepID=UPI002D7E80F5|nr:TonB-dependent receptor [Frateuria sp.]